MATPNEETIYSGIDSYCWSPIINWTAHIRRIKTKFRLTDSVTHGHVPDKVTAYKIWKRPNTHVVTHRYRTHTIAPKKVQQTHSKAAFCTVSLRFCPWAALLLTSLEAPEPAWPSVVSKSTERSYKNCAARVAAKPVPTELAVIIETRPVSESGSVVGNRIGAVASGLVLKD